MYRHISESAAAIVRAMCYEGQEGTQHNPARTRTTWEVLKVRDTAGKAFASVTCRVRHVRDGTQLLSVKTD